MCEIFVDNNVYSGVGKDNRVSITASRGGGPPQQTRSLTVQKRNASLYPSSDRPALPVLPAQSRALVRPNC